jgi:hypothetical protein
MRYLHALSSSRAPRKVYDHLERLFLVGATDIFTSFPGHHNTPELIIYATSSPVLICIIPAFPSSLLFTPPLLLLSSPAALRTPTMKEREEKEKSKLSIRLAEPVIYLKDVDFSGRRRTHNELSPPSIVRGILVLHLSKPTKICSIGIELSAKSSTRYPEGTLPIRDRCCLA